MIFISCSVIAICHVWLELPSFLLPPLFALLLLYPVLFRRHMPWLVLQFYTFVFCSLCSSICISIFHCLLSNFLLEVANAYEFRASLVKFYDYSTIFSLISSLHLCWSLAVIIYFAFSMFVSRLYWLLFWFKACKSLISYLAWIFQIMNPILRTVLVSIIWFTSN